MTEQLDVAEHILETDAQPRKHWRSVVTEVQCPTLLVIGEPDLGDISSSGSAEEIAAINDNFAVTQISGAGHNIRREQFEQYVSVAD